MGEDAAVRQVTLPDGTAAWVVSQYDDVRAGLADPRLSLDKAHAKEWRGLSLPAALDANLLNMDPPDHTRLRNLVGRAFTPRRVTALRPAVQRIADDLLDALEPAGSGDVIADYAAPLAATVICDLLGVPVEGRAGIRGWVGTLTAVGDPVGLATAIEEVSVYLAELIAIKRQTRGEDLLSALVVARDERGGLTEDELLSLAFLLIGAGFENSVNLIANGLVLLLRHPEQLRAVRRSPASVEEAVEEFLRFDPPAPLAFRRFPTEDVTIGGSPSPPARRSCCPSPPLTGTRPGSAFPSDSTSGGPTIPTSPSATASTTAWARHWPGSRPWSAWVRCSAAYPAWPWPYPPTTSAGARPSEYEAYSNYPSAGSADGAR